MLCCRSIQSRLDYQAQKVQWLMFPAPPEGQLQTELFRALSKAPYPLVPLAMICRMSRGDTGHPQQVCRQHSPGGSWHCPGQAQHKPHMKAKGKDEGPHLAGTSQVHAGPEGWAGGQQVRRKDPGVVADSPEAMEHGLVQPTGPSQPVWSWT